MKATVILLQYVKSLTVIRKMLLIPELFLFREGRLYE